MQKNFNRMNWLDCVTHVIIMSLSVSRVIGKKHDMSAWNANFLGKHKFANYNVCQNNAEARIITYFFHCLPFEKGGCSKWRDNTGVAECFPNISQALSMQIPSESKLSQVVLKWCPNSGVSHSSYIFYCGFSSNWILHYFPTVRPCVRHRRDISHFSHI